MKKILIVLLIVVIYVLAALGMEYYVGDNIYLFLGGNVRFHYTKGEWTNEAGKRAYNKFQIYDAFSYKKIGTYDVKYENGWLIKAQNKYASNNNVILFKGKGNLSIAAYEVVNSTSDKKVESVLKKYKLPATDYNGYYINLDIDGDGDNEKIYCIKNFYNGMYLERTTYYSMIYVIDNDNVQELAISKSSTQPQWSYEVSYVMDVNNDNKYEILISKSNIELSNNIKIEMYGLEDGKYVKLVSTE